MQTQQQAKKLEFKNVIQFISIQETMDQNEKDRAAKCFFKLCSFPYEGRILCYTQIEALDDVYSVPEKYQDLTYLI